MSDTPDMVQLLKTTRLCRNMEEAEIETLLKNHNSMVREYPKGVRIFAETEKPDKLFVLLSGSVVIAKDTLAGKRLMIAQIRYPGELFGEVYAFMEIPVYDMYAEALEETVILSLNKSIFYGQGDSQAETVNHLRNNLMEIFAQKAYMMNRKLRVLGSAGIREKIARFLFDRQDAEGNITVRVSREEMADYLNTTRPSLSRELGKMAKEGIVRIDGRNLIVVNQKALEEYL